MQYSGFTSANSLTRDILGLFEVFEQVQMTWVVTLVFKILQMFLCVQLKLPVAKNRDFLYALWCGGGLQTSVSSSKRLSNSEIKVQINQMSTVLSEILVKWLKSVYPCVAMDIVLV